MNYFPFHLGDYASHTAHLEPMEDLAYRRMLDLYYLREGVLPLDVEEIARLTRLKTFQKEIASILNEFFERSDDGWFSVRCDSEILKMKDKQAKAKASAHASVIARSTNAQRTLNERSTNAELPTPTPTPTPLTIVSKDTKALTRPLDVSQDVWDAYLKIRKAKNAPLTEIALNRIRKQGEKACLTLEDTLLECIDRNWAGFKVDWYLRSNTRGASPPNKQTALEARNKAVGDQWLKDNP